MSCGDPNCPGPYRLNLLCPECEEFLRAHPAPQKSSVDIFLPTIALFMVPVVLGVIAGLIEVANHFVNWIWGFG